MSIQKRSDVSPEVVPSNLRRGPRVLALGLAALATGCGVESAGPAHPEPSSQAQAVVVLPATCQDIKAAQPNAGDGDYVLYVGGDSTLSWNAYCHGMAGTPAEYLPLVQAGPDSNYSQYRSGGESPGTTVRTVFSRLRIDPITLKVNTGDRLFSTSTGSLSHSPDTVTSMPYGVAMTCDESEAPANVDLRGTPFVVALNQFALGGADAGGSAVYSNNNQVVALSGGGYCGWIAPVGSYNPFNGNGALLQLEYKAVDRPATCLDIKTANPMASDGNYTLYVNKDPLKPWLAWCQDMAGTPAEYLSLVQTGDTVNFSQYTAGGKSPGTNVKTQFTRIRLDPATLNVNTGDPLFSTSTGSLSHSPDTVTSMPYAAAMGCNTLGLANIDLRGTPFAVPSNKIAIGGVSTGGASFTYSSANQVVNMYSRGYCGWVGPVGSYNPFNQNGAPLPLNYVGPQ
jgi:hypothetical protein